MFKDMKIVTASGDHTAKLFDVSDSDIREIKTFYGHSRSVKTIVFRKDDPSVFATGARDGNIIVWDTRTDVGSFIGKPDRVISNSHSAGRKTGTKRKCFCSPSTSSVGNKSVTGLVFQDDNTLVSCGAGDGIIKVWDLRKNYMFYKKDPLPKERIPYSGSTAKNGFSSLILDKGCTRLYANCLDNTIYCYNLQTYNPEPVMKYVGHQNSTFYIKSSLSQDGNYLISGSSDENAYIWNTNQSNPLVRLTGHNAEVTCVAWCQRNDSTTLVTCSDDMSHKIWRIGPEELPENWEVIGKGRAEILPLLPNKFKRQINNIDKPRPKKFITECLRCENPSTNGALCENCASLKRKHLEEINFNNKRRNTDFSPKTLLPSFNESETGESKDLDANNSGATPTENLPNFVLDGIAPHLNVSPIKEKGQDWLTQLRNERKFKFDIDHLSSPSSPKMPRLETTPKRGTSPQLKSPILRYFKVKCDGHSCSSKANNGHHLGMQSPKSSH